MISIIFAILLLVTGSWGLLPAKLKFAQPHLPSRLKLRCNAPEIPELNSVPQTNGGASLPKADAVVIDQSSTKQTSLGGMAKSIKTSWNKNKLLSKESIAKLGLNALLAYGFVSNISYITCVIIAWVLHGKATGLSPLASGQWKPFLAVYAGLWAANNLLRPLRFSLSLLLTPVFNNFINFVEAKTGFKRATATGIVVFLVNFCGTISYLVFGVLLATSIAGVPLR